MQFLGKRLVALAPFAVATPALAQVQTGSVLVRTKDTQGAVLPGAAITITSPVLVAPMTGTTDSGGACRISPAPQAPLSARGRSARSTESSTGTRSRRGPA